LVKRTAAAVLALALLSCSSATDKPARVPAHVSYSPHLDADLAVHLHAPDAKVLAVAVPQEAGRIVHYSLDGENILWNPLDSSGQAKAAGGYGLDLGPERTIARHPVIWEQRHQWASMGTNVVTLASEKDPAVGMRVEKQLAMDGATGTLDIVQRMINVSEKQQSYCFWDRTLCKAGGFTVIPLNPKSRFPAKWVIGTRKVVDGKVDPNWWEYNGKNPSHPGIKVLDGMVIARSQGKEQKIGADSDAGWIAYVRGRLLFVKYYPYFPDGNYTDNGLSVAHYFNERLAELEPLSPEIPLRPDDHYLFPERWTLTRLDREVTTHEEARALAARIPPCPFVR
jgi:hypothetical protein